MTWYDFPFRGLPWRELSAVTATVAAAAAAAEAVAVKSADFAEAQSHYRTPAENSLGWVPG